MEGFWNLNGIKKSRTIEQELALESKILVTEKGAMLLIGMMIALADGLAVSGLV